MKSSSKFGNIIYLTCGRIDEQSEKRYGGGDTRPAVTGFWRSAAHGDCADCGKRISTIAVGVDDRVRRRSSMSRRPPATT